MKFRVCLFLGSALVLAACGSSSAPASPAPVVVTAPTSTTVSSTASIEVPAIPAADYAAGKTSTVFSPANASVLVGGTVTWTNNDIVTHISAGNSNLWNSEIGPGAKFSLVFSTVGSFDYRCTIHPGMTGTVTVK